MLTCPMIPTFTLYNYLGLNIKKKSHIDKIGMLAIHEHLATKFKLTIYIAYTCTYRYVTYTAEHIIAKE